MQVVCPGQTRKEKNEKMHRASLRTERSKEGDAGLMVLADSINIFDICHGCCSFLFPLFLFSFSLLPSIHPTLPPHSRHQYSISPLLQLSACSQKKRPLPTGSSFHNTLTNPLHNKHSNNGWRLKTLSLRSCHSRHWWRHVRIDLHLPS